MPLQSSGAISISQINTEVTAVNSTSLTTLSTSVGKSAPHAMSEFYGYSSAPSYDYYLMTEYACDGGSCTTTGLEQYCAFPAGTGINSVRYYLPSSPTGFAYKFITSSGQQVAIIMSATQYINCAMALGCGGV